MIGEYTDLQVGNGTTIECNTIPPIPNSIIIWQSLNVNVSNNKLILNPVTLFDNNINYTCVVSSDLLSMDLTKSITVTVRGK